MTSAVNRRWAMVGAVWLAVAVLLHLDGTLMDEIRRAQTQVEVLGMDAIYLRGNFETVTRVLEKRARLDQTVESLKLGLLSVENRLRALSGEEGLADFSFEARTDADSGESIPLLVGFTGSFEAAVGWLDRVSELYPYLRFERLRLAIDRNEQTTKFEFAVNYRFKIAAPEATQ